MAGAVWTARAVQQWTARASRQYGPWIIAHWSHRALPGRFKTAVVRQWVDRGKGLTLARNVRPLAASRARAYFFVCAVCPASAPAVPQVLSQVL